MDSSATEVAKVFLPQFPMFQVYKDGRVERLRKTETVPPSDDPQTGVQSKDTVVSQEPLLSARLFLPKITNPTAGKLPLFIYIHGGAFCMESPFSPLYHKYLSSLVAKAHVIAVSVEYRLAPEHFLPTAYDDTWTAIKWVASHITGDGPEAWLNNHADFRRVFIGGDSAGGNIAHNIVKRAGAGVENGIEILGMVLMNPFFMNDQPDELIEYIFPSRSGCDDPRLNPAANAVAELGNLACKRILVCVSEKDFVHDRGITYYDAVRRSGWNGEISMVETPEEGHVFFLFKPSSDKAVELINQVSSFLNR